MRKHKDVIIGEDDAFEYVIKELQDIKNRIERMEQKMATRTELNAGLDGISGSLGSLSAAIDALKAALAAGSDFQVELDKVTAINAAIQAAIANAQV
jgi:hypothetical protein